MPVCLRLSISAVLLTAACAPAGPSSAPTPDPAAPVAATVSRTVPGIATDDLRHRVFVFADDSLAGREAGTAGHAKATDYLAAELRRLGVEPAGENGTYFQTLPFYQSRLDRGATLAIGDVRLVVERDYVPLSSEEFPYATRGEFDRTSIVYGGPMGAPGALPPDRAAGKFVVFGAPLSPMGVEQLMAELPGRYAAAAGIALAFLEFIPEEILPYFLQPQARLSPDARGGPVGLLITTPTAQTMLGVPLGAARVGEGTRELRGTVGFADAPVLHPVRNVIGVVRGSDSVLAHEFVALGAHSDHVGVSSPAADHDSLRIYNAILRPQGADSRGARPSPAQLTQVRVELERARRRSFPRPDSISNGADDDASGSMALLEIAEAAATTPSKPRRSLLFVWHAGEEEGLLGSEYFTDHPTVARDSIVAQINVDMIGRGGADDQVGGGPGYVQVIGSRRLSAELGDLVEATNVDGQHGLAFDYQYDVPGHPEQYYCRSDHYMYARFGIPVAFFSTGSHRDYHMVTDEPQYLDFPKMTRITEFLYDLARAIADLDHRPVVDRPIPDPGAPCVQ